MVVSVAKWQRRNMKSFIVNLGGNPTKITIFERGKERWLELPAMRLNRAIDCIDLQDTLQEIMPFLEEEKSIHEVRLYEQETSKK